MPRVDLGGPSSEARRKRVIADASEANDLEAMVPADVTEGPKAEQAEMAITLAGVSRPAERVERITQDDLSRDMGRRRLHTDDERKDIVPTGQVVCGKNG